MHMHINTKHVWGFPLSQNIFCQEFAVPQLIHCGTKCNNILKWGLGHFIFNLWFHCPYVDVSLQKSGKKLIPANYLVHGMEWNWFCLTTTHVLQDILAVLHIFGYSLQFICLLQLCGNLDFLACGINVNFLTFIDLSNQVEESSLLQIFNDR